MATMPDLDRLKSQLLTSGLQQKDFPLFQVIDQLIQAVRQTIDTVDDALGTSGSGGGAAFGQTFTTVQNEKVTLPNSRQLTAGQGIQFNDTFKRLIISGAIPPGFGEGGNDTEQGDMGPPGISGSPGIPGANGVAGPIGPMGMDGNEGDEGPIGPPGMPGPQGLTGPTGPSGGNSLPYWFDSDEFDYPETLPQISLNSPQYINAPWTFNKAPTFPALSIPETAIIDGTLLARNADNETITGQWSFNGANYAMNNANFFFQGVNPQIFFNENDQPLDGKYWRFLLDSAFFQFGIMNDALTVFAPAMQILRAANVIQSFAFITNGLSRTTLSSTGTLGHAYGLAFTGRSTVALAADQTAWNPTGLGTVFHIIVVNVTSTLNIRGITAQSDGYVVAITNNNTSSFAINLTHEDGAASASNRILGPNNANISLGLNYTAMLIYDGGALRWRALSVAKP